MSRWDPWKQVDEAPVDLHLRALSAERGRWSRGPERDQIVLDLHLDRRSRREVLAHELVHAERRVGWPEASAATMELEEERVWRIALRRLAPPAELVAFIRARSSVGPVTVADVAEEFDLSPVAARRAVALLWTTGSPALAELDGARSGEHDA